jgi:hypothetical protein
MTLVIIHQDLGYSNYGNNAVRRFVNISGQVIFGIFSKSTKLPDENINRVVISIRSVLLFYG